MTTDGVADLLTQLIQRVGLSHYRCAKGVRRVTALSRFFDDEDDLAGHASSATSVAEATDTTPSETASSPAPRRFSFILSPPFRRKVGKSKDAAEGGAGIEGQVVRAETAS